MSSPQVDVKPSTPQLGAVAPSTPSTSATAAAAPPTAVAAGAAISAPPALAEGTKKDDDEDMIPEYAGETIYVNNLNERIKLDVMRKTLRNLFRYFGPVQAVVAHSNVRMRGQAFVCMRDAESAQKAVKQITGFPLYGKPVQASFAKTQGDAVVRRLRPDAFDEHKNERLDRKKQTRKNNPVYRKLLAKRWAAKNAAAGADATAGAGAAGAAAPGKRIVQVPDEYLPPNKILFVQNLPDDATRASIEAIFSPFPNLVDVRTIPGRRNIAFVEYTDEESSTAAREKLHNTRLPNPNGSGEMLEGRLKVTFAKQ